MIRNLKALGLAMTAFLALGAVYAAGASAQQGKLTSDGPVTLTGTEVGALTENRLTTTGRFVQCPGSTYTGHKVLTHTETTGEPEADPPVPPKSHELIPNAATEVTLTPQYKETNAAGEPNCIGSGGSSSTIHMNGCDYVAKIGATTGGVAGTYGVTFDIVCPTEKNITVTTWYSKADHLANPGTPRCILHVPPKTNLAGAHATNETKGHIKLQGTVEGITVEKTAHNDPLLVCLTGKDENAKFDLNVTVSGDNSLGEKTSVSLSH